jgi:hypothetical protein
VLRFFATACPRVAAASAILMFTSLSEQSTPAELSMKSVLMRPPASERDAPGLRHAEVRAFADHLGAHFGGIDAQGIIGRIADRTWFPAGPSHRCRCRRTTAGRPAPQDRG